MNTDHLFSALSAIHPLSENFKQAIQRELTFLSLPKNHLLLEAPAVASYLYFLDRGFAMSYTFVAGKKKVDRLWGAGQIVIPMRSFFTQLPSTEFVQLMAQSDVFYLRYSSVLTLLDTFPEGNHLYRKIMYDHYENCRSRLHAIQWLPAKERYHQLREVFPKIEQLLRQEEIASYLGIAPQSLSRLKRNADPT